MPNPVAKASPVSPVFPCFQVLRKYEGTREVDEELGSALFGWPAFEKHLAEWLNYAGVRSHMPDRDILAVRCGDEERWYMVIRVPEWVVGESRAIPTGDYQLRFLRLTDQDRRIIAADQAKASADPGYQARAGSYWERLEERIRDCISKP
ncbi:hypothetical protein HYW17_05380 [Candidatus Uhrbacteria bacterium]|nr:hypothetical protein [Candidatus Uhrbacteria bacterium]